MAKYLIVTLSLVSIIVIAYSCYAEDKNESEKTIRPKEIKMDRDYDGKIDTIETYDSLGKIKERSVDTNANGNMDQVVFFENGVPVKAERDINEDGKSDGTVFYDDKGVVKRTETDTDNDGKIDEYVSYENGEPFNMEKDTNGDGNVDTWLKY
ncbi:MAG: hypothetical protein HQL30_11320 [Candidatus Omnitrophica bacterium]|nr:hypothetical protein [Candidatus Omnitrophota bacterium]